MKRLCILVSSSILLASCGRSENQPTNNGAAANAAQAEKPHAYCFFKDEEMKGWTAKRDQHGDISVDGEAHVADPRYKASFSKVAVGPKKAIFELTISQNDLGYAMRDNWWHVGLIAPNSASLTEATVQCGDKLVADLKLPPKG
ncbi:MAG TPA: hypothetical protein VE968_04350 [Sphingomicrobium sp.]|nr:hypothetical protein [Sphingomicrobium sp.]